MPPPFSGSYAPEDVTFLLTPVDPAAAAAIYTPPASKERLIQQGLRHYSEMISPEAAPTPAYMAIYQAALARHGRRMAREVGQLVRAIDARVAGPLTLCSLVRAGVPLGVLLQRGLRELGRDCVHFGVSIIRDRGIDGAAMAHVLDRRPAEGVLFVDGWTGKGAIAQELETALSGWPALAPRLVVLADPAGRAWLCASHDDWLIPSGILGSTVSGLISRSILNAALAPRDAFHAALDLRGLAPHDVSRPFVDRIFSLMAGERAGSGTIPEPQANMRRTAETVMDGLAARFGITNRNRIKPGIAEATRAVLRRVPHRILVAGDDDPDLAGLLHLAGACGVAVETPQAPLHPYRAVTIIADAASDAPALELSRS